MSSKKSKKKQESEILQRKLDHIELAARDDMDMKQNSLDEIDLAYCALPEIALRDVKTDTMFLGSKMSFPLMISSMSGGPRETGEMNRVFARAAEAEGIALALGSIRAAIEHPEAISSFCVRKEAPNIPLLMNIGAVQLNYGVTADQLNVLIEKTKVDALILHLNPLQEALQPEGDTDFSGLLSKIEQVCKRVQIPVMVKEVGAGISGRVAKQLESAGVSMIDVSGTGGTSWAKIEASRSTKDESRKTIRDTFSSWGVPTVRAIQESADVLRLSTTLVTGGGIRTGLDIAKSIVLGAHIVTLARPFLLAYRSTEGPKDPVERVRAHIKVLRDELRIACFCAGAKNMKELRLAGKKEAIVVS